FLVEAGWFRLVGSGMTQARLLSAVAGVATVIVVAWLLRRLVGQGAGLLAAAFVAFDGWLVFTNRVGWAENVQVPLGLIALWGFWRLSTRPTWARLYAAGLVLGAITVYKLVGVTFLLGGLLYLWLERYRLRQFLTVLAGAATMGVAFVLGMSVWAGKQFISDNYHQLLRATGIVKSRGAVQGTSSAVGPLVHQYSIYLASVGLLALVGGLLLWRCWQVLIETVRTVRLSSKPQSWFGYVPLAWRSLRNEGFEPVRRANSLLFAWALASYAVFGLGHLWLPHYLILILVPAACYLAAELQLWLRQRSWGKLRKVMVTALTLLVIAGGLVSYAERIVVHPDNAVGQTLAWMADAQNAPPDAKVITEEFIGNQIGQPYCKITHAQECEQAAGRPDFIITYETTTEKLPTSQALTRLLGYGTVVAEFTGFKETIRIYKIRPAIKR
ncbi:MAG TPA: glycosyltransferase family 39 protein, partial [Candidatus Saccharimonas sp.]|nr:glycosyltransferase family 39 protein [Candidatus Saccharimonas sp.]